MALKKSQLYASLWSSCDALRGGMDASQYKDYVLTLLFMKYVSDRAAGDPQSLIRVPDRGGFEDMARLKGTKGIGDELNKIIGRLAEVNDLKGIIDLADFNDGSRLGSAREMRDRLSKLVAIFEGLDLRANRAGDDDLLGDAYEYLMRHFATQSGKSKGQFYTPGEVSRIVAKVVGIGPTTRADHTIYDPTCGSGSLLLKAADEAPNGISIYGQEMDNATYALARMNMILHGYETADLKRGNTLAAPAFLDASGGIKTFDFAVANPPFSFKEWTSGVEPDHDPFDRFEFGVPPAKNGDYAFLLHLLKSLGPRGKGAIILPHGVLFRANREGAIRRELLRRGFIAGVIGLPANLFYGTGIPACIVILDKEAAHARRGVFMIDASLGFRKDGNKNRLRAQDIHRIVEVFNQRLEQPRYSRVVPLTEINDPANNYNLNLSRYIDTTNPEDIHDLDAHLNGGIPNRALDVMQDYWDALPGLRSALLQPIPDRPGYSAIRVEKEETRNHIAAHAAYVAYRKRFNLEVDRWIQRHEPRLRAIQEGDSPREIIGSLSEDLLRRFHDFPLIDAYDLYQSLMDYWDTTMADDVHLVSTVGWTTAIAPRLLFPKSKSGGQLIETPDLAIGRSKYKMDLVPPSIVLARFFQCEQSQLDEYRATAAAARSAVAALVEKHSGDDELFGESRRSGKITRTAVRFLIKNLRCDNTRSDVTKDEELLLRCLKMADTEAAAKKTAKDAEHELYCQLLSRYASLTEDEIQDMAVAEKWIPTIHANLDSVLFRTINSVSDCIRTLDERYSTCLISLEADVHPLSDRIRSDTELQQLIAGSIRLHGFLGPWTRHRIGDLGMFFKGSGITRNDLRSAGVPCIRYGELYTRYGNHIYAAVERVRPAAVKGAVPLRAGDILFACSGETAEEIGRCSAYLAKETAYAGGDIAVLRPSGHDPRFLGYLLNQPQVAIQKARLGQGDAVVHISTQSLSKIEVDLPSLQEQQAIARVLADMDREIASVQRRKEKLQFIRSSMMQQMLSCNADGSAIEESQYLFHTWDEADKA